MPVSAVVADEHSLVVCVRLATPPEQVGDELRARVRPAAYGDDDRPPPFDTDIPEEHDQVFESPFDDQPGPIEKTEQYSPQTTVTLLVRGR